MLAVTRSQILLVSTRNGGKLPFRFNPALMTFWFSFMVIMRIDRHFHSERRYSYMSHASSETGFRDAAPVTNNASHARLRIAKLLETHRVSHTKHSIVTEQD